MIDLGAAEFHLDVPSLTKDALENAAIRLFDRWDAAARIGITLDDYSIALTLDEGSIKGYGRLAAAATVVYFCIGAYGDFVQGLRTINEQIIGVKEYLTQEAPKFFRCPPSLSSAKRRPGATEKLNSLFSRVRSGELSPEQATEKAMQIFGDAGDEVPGFFQAISEAFRSCPKDPKQPDLPFVDLYSDVDLGGFPSKVPGKNRGGKAPLAPVSNQFRVEVWRESTGKRKQTKVTLLG